jgi:hypothetical protein
MLGRCLAAKVYCAAQQLSSQMGVFFYSCIYEGDGTGAMQRLAEACRAVQLHLIFARNCDRRPMGGATAVDWAFSHGEPGSHSRRGHAS